MSDIDHGNGERLVGASGGQYPLGRLGVHRRQGSMAPQESMERNHPVGRRVNPAGAGSSTPAVGGARPQEKDMTTRLLTLRDVMAMTALSRSAVYAH